MTYFNNQYKNKINQSKIGTQLYLKVIKNACDKILMKNLKEERLKFSEFIPIIANVGGKYRCSNSVACVHAYIIANI